VTQFDIRSADSTNLDMQLTYHRVGAVQDISNRREVPNRKAHGCEYVKVILGAGKKGNIKASVHRWGSSEHETIRSRCGGERAVRREWEGGEDREWIEFLCFSCDMPR